MLRHLILSACLFMIFMSVCGAASVQSDKGNIVYTDDAGKRTTLTSTGRDEYPALHPKGEWVYFIRSFEGEFKDEKYCPPKGKKVEPGALQEELWRVKKDGTKAKMLYRAKSSAIDGPDMDYPVYSVFNIQFSPYGDKVYFETPEWVTSAGLHVMNADGSGEKLLGPGTNTKIILSARTFDDREKDYRGYIVTSKHRYFFYGGSYDWWYLYTPDLKKEIAPLGDDPAYFTDMGEIKYTDGSEKDPSFSGLSENGVSVYPKDIGWEVFTKEQLGTLQKEVDAGHQPWRTDPIEVGGAFLRFFYGVDKDGVIPMGKVEQQDSNATVTVDYLDRRHTIVLDAPIKKPSQQPEEGGIWVVQWMTINPINKASEKS